MSKKYISTTIFIIISIIYTSFFFIQVSIFQGYLIALIIFFLGLINYFVVRKMEIDFPFIFFTFMKIGVKFINYKFAFLGSLLLLIGLIFFAADYKMPFTYISICTGIYFYSFVKIKCIDIEKIK